MKSTISIVKYSLASLLLLVLAPLFANMFAHYLSLPLGLAYEVNEDDLLYLAYFLMCPIVLYILHLISKQKTFSLTLVYLKCHRVSLKGMFISVLATVALIYTFNSILMHLNVAQDPYMTSFYEQDYSPFILLLLGMSIVIFAPLIEEVIFRGWMFRKLEESTVAPLLIVAVNSGIFTLIHTQYSTSSAFFYVFGLGVFLSGIRYVTKNLSYCILAHATANLSAFSYLL